MSEDYASKIKEYYKNQLDVAVRSNDKEQEKFFRKKLSIFNLFAVKKEEVKVKEVEKQVEKLHKPGNIGKRTGLCVKCGNEMFDKRLSLCEDCKTY